MKNRIVPSSVSLLLDTFSTREKAKNYAVLYFLLGTA